MEDLSGIPGGMLRLEGGSEASTEAIGKGPHDPFGAAQFQWHQKGLYIVCDEKVRAYDEMEDSMVKEMQKECANYKECNVPELSEGKSFEDVLHLIGEKLGIGHKNTVEASSIKQPQSALLAEPLMHDSGFYCANALSLGNAFLDEEDLMADEAQKVIGILNRKRDAPWMPVVEATMYLNSTTGHILFARSDTSGSSSSSLDVHYDWVMAAKDFLFSPHNYRLGRVMAADSSYSGCGWIHDGFHVITCSHVVQEIRRRNQVIIFKLPNDVEVEVDVLYCCTPSQVVVSYKRDIAILRMIQVRGATPIALNDLQIGSYEAGEPVWTMECLTAGVVPCFSTVANMLNAGRIESCSSALTTTNARADRGFSGGPVLSKNCKIIGMIQGGVGVDTKSVAIIPIEDISALIDVFNNCTLSCVPALPLPMHTDSPVPY